MDSRRETDYEIRQFVWKGARGWSRNVSIAAARTAAKMRNKAGKSLKAFLIWLRT